MDRGSAYRHSGLLFLAYGGPPRCWHPCSPTATAQKGPHLPLYADQGLRASVWLRVVNTAFATWLTAKSRVAADGYVHLAVRSGDGMLASHPIPADVPHRGELDLGEIELLPGVAERTTLTLQMAAKGRMRFGQRLSITLRPAR